MEQSLDEIYNCSINNLRLYIEELPPKSAAKILKSHFYQAAELYRMGEESLSGSDNEIESVLLRNEAWFKKLNALHLQGFFAVFGFKHLGYAHPRGLLSLFEKNGYKVTRIDSGQKFKDLNM
ncbi:MAG: hypothetical protein H6625_11450 [Bdellovibrionaceae bacterium]|nr:hypothetical protein [Pseudobdellovibrionaceae bacterium]